MRIKSLVLILLVFFSISAPVRFNLRIHSDARESSFLTLDVCHAAGNAFSPADSDIYMLFEAQPAICGLMGAGFIHPEDSLNLPFAFPREKKQPPEFS